MFLEVSDTDYNKIINVEKPVIILFFAKECTASAELFSTLSNFTSLTLYLYDLEFDRELARELKLVATPCLVRYYKGKIIDMKYGALSEEALKDWLLRL